MKNRIICFVVIIMVLFNPMYIFADELDDMSMVEEINSNTSETFEKESDEKSDEKGQDKVEANEKETVNEIKEKSDVESNRTIEKRAVNSTSATPTETPTIPEVTISDGEYEIRAKGNKRSIFDIDMPSSRLQFWQDADTVNQRFYITHIGNGYYKISVRANLKVIDVSGAGKANGTWVQQYVYNGSDAQKWIIKDNGNGYYSFVSKCNSLYMTITDNNASNGSKVIMHSFCPQYMQEFELNKVMKDIPKKSIEDGEYEIRSAVNSSRVFDIDTGSNPQGAKLQLWKDNDVTQQRFYISHIGNGYYKIICRRSGKGLDVENAGIKNGTKVQQYDYYGGVAQNWIIKDAGDGYYNIVARCNGYYMTAINDNARDGTAIQMFEQNGSNNQKFILDKVLKDTGTQSIENGEYEIRSAVNNAKVFDIDTGSNPQGAKLQLWNDNNVTQQRFYVTYLGNGFYKIINRRSGKSIDVACAGITNGTRVQQYDYNGTDAQSWIIKDAGDGYYNIISKCNGYYMMISNGNATDGTSINMYQKNNSDNQKFIFDKVLKDKPAKSIENGEYEIRSALDESRIFDIDTGSNPQGAKLQLWHDNNVDQQRFQITYLGNGYYKIINKRSGKGLDVQDAGIQNGTKVQQYDYYGSVQQNWIIKDVGDGYYSIISRCNGYYMTATNNNAKDGTPITMYEKNNNASQKFKIERVKDELAIDVSTHNGKIDWPQVKSAGVDVAMIRVGYRGYETGKIVSDTKFNYNIENALKNNIKVGVYFYSQAITEQEAIDEANWVVQQIKKYNITYPVVFDSEFATGGRDGRADWLDKNTRTKVCKAFCETIKKNGYTPMIYASKSWFNDELNFNDLKSYKVWVAHYTYDPSKKTDFKYPYMMWQYTDRGRIPGINSNVDMNVLN